MYRRHNRKGQGRKGRRETYRAHWTSWLCFAPGNARWQDEHTVALEPGCSGCGTERVEEVDSASEDEWVSFRRFSECILRPLNGWKPPIV